MSAVKTDQSEGIPGAGIPEQAVKKNAYRLRRLVSPQPLRFLFALIFSIHAFPTISEPGTGSVAPLKSLYFHWIAICSSSIVFTPRSLFLLFVLLFSGLIVEDLTTAATSPPGTG